MPRTATYSLIASAAGTGSSGTVTFSSIPTTFTDLVIVANGTTASNTGWSLQFNSDTASNYSTTYVEGSGTAAVSERYSSTILRVAWNSLWNSSTPSNNIVNIQDYANTTTYKTVLFRSNSSSYVEAGVGLWRATPAAITNITITTAAAGGANFTTASTFKLYGIQAGNA